MNEPKSLIKRYSAAAWGILFLLLGVLMVNRLRSEQVEKTLRESEDRYRSLFDNSIDAVLLTAPDGRILAANPEACRIFGRTEEEMYAPLGIRMYPPELREYSR